MPELNEKPKKELSKMWLVLFLVLVFLIVAAVFVHFSLKSGEPKPNLSSNTIVFNQNTTNLISNYNENGAITFNEPLP